MRQFNADARDSAIFSSRVCWAFAFLCAACTGRRDLAGQWDGRAHEGELRGVQRGLFGPTGLFCDMSKSQNGPPLDSTALLECLCSSSVDPGSQSVPCDL